MERRHRVVAVIVVVAVLLLLGGVWFSGDDTARSTRRDAVATGGPVTKGRKVVSARGAHSIDAPNGTLRIEGQVIDDQERPVAAATVTIHGDRDVTTTSEADGGFAFDGLLAARYSLTAHEDDHYVPRVIVRVHAAVEPVILRMQRGMTVAITVVAADSGAPIAGASVHDDGGPPAVTDARGVAELRGVSDFFHTFEATARGYAPGEVDFMVGRDPGGRIERTIALIRGSPVAGIVVGPDGRAVVGASVSVEAAATHWSGEVVSDAGGHWRFEALGAGTHVFEARAPGYASGTPTTAILDGTGYDDLVVSLVAGGAVSGVVVDAQGQPAANARVKAIIGQRTETAYADATGAFRIGGLSAGAWQVFASAGPNASPLVALEVSATPLTGVRLVVGAGLITGVVVDDLGRPVAEAEVGAMQVGGFKPVGNLHDVADSSGRFELGPLPRASYELRAERPGVRDPRELDDGLPAKPGDRDVKLTVAGVATLTGVVAFEGAPVQDYFVALMPPDGFEHMASTTGVHDRAGRFATKAAAGNVIVIVTGASFATKRIDGVVAVAGKTIDLGTIAVDRGRVVKGRVVDDRRNPVDGARVVAGMIAGSMLEDGLDIAEALMSGVRSAITGADGRFTVIGVETMPDGRPTPIIAVHPRHGRADGVLSAPGEIELVLGGTGSIAGTVTLAPGSPSIEIGQIGGTGHAFVQPSADGAYRADRLPPGRYRVAAMIAPDRMGPETEVEVRPGQVAKADLAFPRDTVTVAVTVHADCGAIFVFAGDRLASHVRCSPGERVIELPGVIPGSYRVCDDGHCLPVTVTRTSARQAVDMANARP